MKQIFQNIRSGEIELTDMPLPKCSGGQLLIATRKTLISAGTERMLVEFGKSGYLEKARNQPEKVRMVLDKIRTDGLLPTLEAVRSKLDQPLQMGYCNAGVVIEVGGGVPGFAVGDRVVSNGPHAEVVRVPMNLCVKIPDNVDDTSASFTVLSAVGLQGVRLAEPTVGEVFVVMGLGLVGLITVQILRANGCRVLGMDYHEGRLKLARRFGAETVDLSLSDDPVSAAKAFSRDRGVDGVLITASAKTSAPVHQAAGMCRKRGRIVLVGVTGLELSRADFYEKELSFQVSCSYGPGRYDPSYEDRGNDYPVGYVRWTEQRNFEAILDMVADGRLDVAPLVSHSFEFEDAAQAYDTLVRDPSALGIILGYKELQEAKPQDVDIYFQDVQGTAGIGKGGAVCCFIGAGNYASRILIPAFGKAGVKLDTIVTQGGISGVYHGRKNGFRRTTTDSAGAVSSGETDTVVIATRHDSHAGFVVDALKAGKHVFVEKPLAISHQELDEIESVYAGLLSQGKPPPLLMVGFNRRFSPHAVKMKELLGGVKGPKSFIVTVNAGALPKEHWAQDARVGGGRIIGECCHFVDLLRFLSGSRIASRGAAFMDGPDRDTATITLKFEDGSIGAIHYFANGSSSFPKERVEVFCQGHVLQLDNFRKLAGYGWKHFRKMNLLSQDKGQASCVTRFVDALRGQGPAPIPFGEIMEVSRAIIDLAQEGA